MPIRTDWNIPLDEVDAEALLSGSMTRIMTRPSVREDWEIARSESQTLIQPVAIWEITPVRQFRHDRLIMENGAV